ncbi:MAG: chemotaxis protein CheA [Pseudomonadota bacterium]
MAFDDIEALIEKLSCDVVLADPEKDPKSLSCLLPTLKNLHGEYKTLAMDDEAKQVLKIKNIINGILKDPSLPLDQKMENIGDLISSLSFSINQSKRSDQDPADEDQVNQETDTTNQDISLADEQSLAEPEIESDLFSFLEEKLDNFDQLIGTFCPDDLPDLGAMIINLHEMTDVSEKIDPPLFHQIAMACLNFVETIPLEDMHNTKPIEEGLVLLRSILTHLRKNEEFVFDYSDVLILLKAQFEKQKDKQDTKTISSEETPEPELIKISVPEAPKERVKILDDDMAILIDFVSEAQENLDSIEVNLIDLEQDPTNQEIINDIFRPFHTIKGVSGFLSLTKINVLAHTTENLLDSARSGDFIIDQTATDAILKSVDTLKKLIENLKQGTINGYYESDHDIDVDTLRQKLKQLQISLSKGETQPLGQILVRNKAIDQNDLDHALETQAIEPDKKIGEILVEHKRVQPKQVAAALMEQNTPKKKLDAQVKVSTQKLDDLVDYAGELVIAQSMLRQRTSDNPSLSQTVSQLGQIVNNMQNIAMSMRMIPIKATFMKMIRLVRDLSNKSGKDVTLNMSGEDTEIDRNVVDALYEPMVHMIRNSADHGIEQKEDRLKAGKPEQGSINLRAYHKGGHIIIEIEDDGQGLDKDRILEKAQATGLIDHNVQMTDAQIYDLILQPGFSTAKKITDVSGRGVGMDVVKSGIEKFRGQLSIQSEKGKGTKFTISLPLTLAIIDGMLVKVDNEKYVIPTISIQKAFKPGKDEYFTVEGKGEMVKDRGKLIPLIRLNEIYKTGQKNKSVLDCLVIVVESKDERRALLIDELLGKDEYVIKSLGTDLEDIEGLAGGAILADGRVGLILDIHGIFSIVSKA